MATGMKLRPYQSKLDDDINTAWRSHKNVLAVSPTGSGKTVLFAKKVHEHQGAICVIAHRQELVGQISLALNRNGVRHRVIAPKSVIKFCVGLHMNDCGKSYFDASSNKAVAGVDTLIRASELKTWCNSVTLWVMDEAHHVLRKNKWGKAVTMFPNAKGLGVTATPTRADGKGLGAHADGVFNVIVEGPKMRTLINSGYLTDYRIFAPPSDLDMSVVKENSGGEFDQKQTKSAIKNSHILGDVVEHYKTHAMGKLGITFASDIEAAQELTDRYNVAGVPAQIIDGKTKDDVRTKTLIKLKNHELLNVVNVDILGEGVDVPAVDVVSFARPTKSFGLYVQQCGRPLRLYESVVGWDGMANLQRLQYIAASRKPYATIFDHVGNVMRHGLPDARNDWTLDAREKRGENKKTTILIKTCLECFFTYERYLSQCPNCGHIHTPVSRGSPEEVSGNLLQLDAQTLAKLRGGVEAIDMPPNEYAQVLVNKYMPLIGQKAAMKRHIANQEGQKILRAMMALWMGKNRMNGMGDGEILALFYLTFGIDVLSAQTLVSKKSSKLSDEIRRNLWR